ncbi:MULTISPECIES: serine/threonine-protein kinase [unclassified Variovorax]|uniref:serine/threonine protein kinase n=1 Tax=unclassified Variovorax TaxID=663243 RepID=UPI0008C5B7A4|nr:MULTISPECIES: serine/threonine-protein kinase [unclassified Variovorax]SEJ86041.1 non-specific serine/threonine protein kinase [Variovorax sp. OK202]SFD01597.1 non-specific serine/threonine protein kinase [Variovorax sp. OK212]
MTTTYGTGLSSGLGTLPAEPQERPHPLGVGHRLDEFELLEVIGEGGFGIVYRAYDHSLQREVAIKEYMPSMLARRVGDNSVHVRSERLTATFEAGLRSFINEARTLAQFSHPALVRVHRFWEANSTAYMAIQLYKGRTLRRLADDEPDRVTETWLLGMLGPLLGALETLHRSHCFHRDIAPDNIFVQHDDSPVLLDFGAARKSIADLVDEVAVMVKSGYSPIEQYADDNTLLQGAWTDLYALGAVLYRAVTGHPPPSAVVRSVQDAYVPLSSMGRADLSPAFCAAVDHTLAVHSKDRTQTVAAFAAELGLMKLGDFYVNGMAAPTVIIPAAPVPSAPPPPELAPQHFPPASAPVPLEPMGAPSFATPPAAAAEPVVVAASTKVKTAAAGSPSAAPASASSAPKKTKHKQKPSGLSWLLVGSLVVALVAVGSWIGLRLTATKQDTSTAMVPVPPPSAPMSNTSSPPAAMPPGTGTAAAVGTPGATDGVPAAGGTAVAGAAPSPTPAQPASAPVASTGPLTPLDSVPVNPPPTTIPPETALATAETEDWNLAQTENTREGYEAYLRRYRRGLHAREARNAIAEINRLAPPPPVAAVDPSALPPGTPVAGTTPAAPPGMGRVNFNIRPWGQVFVDGADRGVSPPLKSLPLRPGIYNIEVRNGDLEVFRQRVTVQDSKSAPVVSHEFK